MTYDEPTAPSTTNFAIAAAIALGLLGVAGIFVMISDEPERKKAKTTALATSHQGIGALALNAPTPRVQIPLWLPPALPDKFMAAKIEDVRL